VAFFGLFILVFCVFSVVGFGFVFMLYFMRFTVLCISFCYWQNVAFFLALNSVKFGLNNFFSRKSVIFLGFFLFFFFALLRSAFLGFFSRLWRDLGLLFTM